MRILKIYCQGCSRKVEVSLRLPEGVKFSADFRYTCKECTGTTLEARLRRRRRRAKLVFMRHRGGNLLSAELNPEATRSTDQTLTEISLKSVNSDCNRAILREQEKAADSLEHIQRGLTAKQKDVLKKVLDVVEPGDSLREVARKAGLHAPQVSRAFAGAREARIFKLPRRPARYRPYNPRGVPMEIVMMPHQGPILYTIDDPNRGWNL